MRPLALAFFITMALATGAWAQEAPPEYLTRPAAPQAGLAPGLKVTELAPRAHSYQLVFAKGDEVAAGLAEFARSHNLTNAHFTAIGAFDAAVIGWFDAEKRAYKVTRIREEMEVASYTGNITRDRNGNPVVHGHCVVALFRNGALQAGHLIEGHVSLTMQLYLDDAEPVTGLAPPRN